MKLFRRVISYVALCTALLMLLTACGGAYVSEGPPVNRLLYREYIRDLFAEVEVTKDGVSLALPASDLEAFDLNIKIEGITPDGAATEVLADTDWEYGQSYQAAVFSGSVADGSEIVVFAEFLDKEGETVYNGAKRWIYEGGAPVEAVDPVDTIVSVSQAGFFSNTQIVITYTESNMRSFRVTLDAPGDWEIIPVTEDDAERYVEPLFAPAYLYIRDTLIGGVAYNTFSASATTYQEIFPELMGSWDNDYKVIPSSVGSVNDVMGVCIIKKDGQPDSRGILLYNLELQKCVAFEIFSDLVSDKQIADITETLVMSPL